MRAGSEYARCFIFILSIRKICLLFIYLLCHHLAAERKKEKEEVMNAKGRNDFMLVENDFELYPFSISVYLHVVSTWQSSCSVSLFYKLSDYLTRQISYIIYGRETVVHGVLGFQA